MFGRPGRTTVSEFGDRVSLTTKSSPLEGPASYYGQTTEIDLKKLGRRESWLWFSALTVTTLSAVALLLTAFSRLFKHKDHFYEITPEQARWGVLCLLLLFNGWMLYRQRIFRKMRKKTALDQALKEFAGRLKEVSRGSDYAVRLANDDFVLVLPKCNVGEVTQVLNRMGSMELECAGKKISLAYTTGWVDYQPGDMPSDLLKRASQLLHLYGDAAKDIYAATETSN